MVVHRKLDPYTRARDAARDLARADPRNQRLHQARSLLEYLPGVALYPLQAETLLSVLVLGFGLWLGAASLLGVALLLAIEAATLTYLLEIVTASANGHGVPPRFSAAQFSQLGGALLVVLPPAAVAVVVRVADAAGLPLLAWGVLLGGGACLPAIIVVFAIERSLLAAFDPRRFTVFMRHGGAAYWTVAVGTIVALGSGVELLPPIHGPADLLGSIERIGALFTDMVAIYLGFAGAHLLGAMVFLRRAELGITAALEPRTEHEETHESLQESVARLLKLADAEEHHGRDLEAVRLLATAPFGSHAARPWLEELFEGACRRPKPYFAETAGQRLVAHLVAIKLWPRALEILVHATQRWPRFQPTTLDERVQLATQALERGNALAFRQLTRDLEALGDAPQRVDLAFLAARWCAEHDHDPAAARRLLAPLLARTGHPAHRRIAALDAALSG